MTLMLGAHSTTVRVHGLEVPGLSRVFLQGPAGLSGCAVGLGVLRAQRAVSDSAQL